MLVKKTTVLLLILLQHTHSQVHLLLAVLQRLHLLVDLLDLDLYPHSLVKLWLRKLHLQRKQLHCLILLVQLYTLELDLTLVVVPYRLLVVELRKSHLIMVRKLYLLLMITVTSLVQQQSLKIVVQFQILLLLVKKITIQFYTIKQFNLMLVELDLSSRLDIREHHLLKRILMRFLLVIQLTLLLKQDLYHKSVILKHRNKQEMLSTNLSSLRLVLVDYSQSVVLLRQSHRQMRQQVYSMYLDLQHSVEQDLTLVVVLYSLSMVQRKQSPGITMKPQLMLLQLRITVMLLMQLQQMMIMDLLQRQQPQVNLLTERSSILLQHIR